MEYPFIEKSGCGILGILRKHGCPKVKFELALRSIEAVRYRGSKLGAGFAKIFIDIGTSKRRVKVFVKSADFIVDIIRTFKAHGLEIMDAGFEIAPSGDDYGSWVGLSDNDEAKVFNVIQNINSVIGHHDYKVRVYSWGRYVDVFKGVGYPTDVAETFGLIEKNPEADLWLAHTRQPTNSPGRYPIWSHPFSAGEWAIVHNGDISSFGANVMFLSGRGYRSFVGTDSEVIAFLLDYLTRVEKLSIEEAATLLCNPFSLSWRLQKERFELRGACLDGPFSVVAGYSDGDDVYLLAMTDRSKLRPLVVGEDEEMLYAASEEAQIRALSERARVWSVEPGSYFLASMKKGVIVSGRRSTKTCPSLHIPLATGYVIDAKSLGHRELYKRVRDAIMAGKRDLLLKNVLGHRYIGMALHEGVRLRVYGTAGNCLANLNEGARIEVYGNAQDDVGDTMQKGSVIIHGDARDVVGQALQGGEIFIKGNVGNRCAIQMREYLDRKPYIIVGGTADNYLGEYMAGGVVVILGLWDKDSSPVGDFVASGMVGGRIYIRGRVSRNKIGVHPPRQDVLQYLKSLVYRGLLDLKVYEELSKEEELTLELLEERLNESSFVAVKRLFHGKHVLPLNVEYRKLNDEDIMLIGHKLSAFFTEFMIGRDLLEEVYASNFTIICPSSK